MTLEYLPAIDYMPSKATERGNIQYQSTTSGEFVSNSLMEMLLTSKYTLSLAELFPRGPSTLCPIEWSRHAMRPTISLHQFISFDANYFERLDPQRLVDSLRHVVSGELPGT